MTMKEIVCGSVLLYFLGMMLTVIMLAVGDFNSVSHRITNDDITAYFWLSVVWPVVVLAAGVRFTTYWLICVGCALRRIFVKDEEGDAE